MAKVMAALAFALLWLPDLARAQAIDERAVAESLDAMHAAAARSDGPAYFDRLSPGLLWIGNDTTELWTREEFIAFAEPFFARGEGWVYSARERRVFPAPDPCQCIAWVDEVLDSETYGTAVGTALMWKNDDGEWRVLRYALTYPIPNDLARGMTDEIKAWEAANLPPAGPPEPRTFETGPLRDRLDAFHRAAAEADGATYFDLFTPDAHYRGTDVTEFWTLAEFRAYAEPYFNQGRGWTYVARDRHVSIVPGDCLCVAWFDEILDSESYGTSRGVGVMLRGEDGQWRIAYYALTFPIPNALARDMTARIRAAEPAAEAGA